MRKIVGRFFPIGTKRRNILSKIKKAILKCYRIVSTKKIRRILKKLGNKKLNIQLSTDDINIYDKYNNQYSKCYELKELNKTIAVHLHLYYKDLLDEMIDYLNNIPFAFDLYVSVVDENENKMIKAKLEKIKRVKKVVVSVTKNSGRDYGPMMVRFGKNLQNYDYVCHIHTKKSLRMGASQDEWRHHLLRGTLGSESLIRKIFYSFEKENIGIFFPDSVAQAPYWANTWMGVNNLGREICGQLGIPFEDRYQDFSVGSMFWVRTESVSEVFERKWTWEDFGEEEGLNDGTLAYVFERLFVLSSNNNGYNFICYNQNEKLFYKNFSERNMHDYYNKNVNSLYEKLSGYDVISFDIFDTLVTRMIYSPSDIFTIMDIQIDKEHFCGKSFSQVRREAEISIGQKIFPEDPSIDQVYEELGKIYNLKKSVVNKFKSQEIDLEKKFLIPRKDMLELFNRLKKDNKRIILISDMYLTSNILEDILKRCGYEGYEKLYVSCETNLRKDRGDIWEKIKKEYNNVKFIHVGDNEESDIHKLWDYGVENEHIMQGKKLFEQTNYGYYTRDNLLNDNIIDSVLYGLIINKKLFNSPFKLFDSKNNYVIENLEEYGYAVVGPVLLKFLLWLIQGIKNDKNTTLLFLAREGYYFESLFKILEQKLDINGIKKVYFQTSRRCVTVASIKNKDDIDRILDIEYYGNMKDFMFYRFGIEYKDKNFDVLLCQDNPDNNRSKVEKVVEKYIPDILKRAELERNNYLKYIKKIVDLKKENLYVVDLGYSGTTQVYLSKLLDKKIGGKYLVVKNNPKPLSMGCKVESCFNKLQNDNDHLLYKNSLFLECFLTAPNGQLMFFDKKIKPVYVPEKMIKEKFKYLDQIYKGVEGLFLDMFEMCGKQLLEFELNSESILSIYQAFLVESNHFIKENKTVFTFEDFYCRSEEIEIEKQSNL